MLGSIPPSVIYAIVYFIGFHFAYISFVAVDNVAKSVLPSYEFVKPTSLNQPANTYFALLGLAKVLASSYVLVKVSPTPLGSVPPSKLYLMV